MMIGYRKVLLAVAAATALSGTSAYGNQIGTIYACYACQNTGNAVIDNYLASGVNGGAVANDGLLFEFVNTSSSAITGATFSVTGSVNDSFVLPTIGANSSFILVPGTTSDGLTHPANGLFNPYGGVMDTSDGQGSVTDASVFSFSGMSNSLAVTSGNFTPGDAALILPYRGNPSSGSTSFIGFGPDGDGPCSNCYYGPIAALSTPSVVATPEPGSYGLLIAGGMSLLVAFRRLRVRNN